MSAQMLRILDVEKYIYIFLFIFFGGGGGGGGALTLLEPKIDSTYKMQ